MVKTLLVIECTPTLNWYEVFKEETINGESIVVEQSTWDDLTIVSYHDSGAVVSIRPALKPLKGTNQNEPRTVVANFILLRSVTRSINTQDSRNKLFALIHANLPSVNTLESAYICLERPLVVAQLKKIQKRMPDFALVKQTFYSSHRDMVISPEFPCVVKIGSCHAGYGKARVKATDEFDDVKSIVALHGDFCTAEPFIDWDWDGRVQKIGNHYRAFKRISTNWKGNVGHGSINEDIEVNEKYKRWIDACSDTCGGLDICALDFVHDKETGKEFILELNDTAIGLVHRFNNFIRDRN